MFFLIAVIVCSVVYVGLNGSKSVHVMSHIEGTSTTIFQNSSNSSKNSSLKRRFPNVIIIGSKKSGTTALLDYLILHPLIKGHQGIHFFDENFDHGLNWYMNQMPLTSETVLTIEKSPSYFVTPLTPKRLHDFSTNVKLILIVRNPIDRTVSDYLHCRDHTPWRALKTKPSFEKAVFHLNGTIVTNTSLINVSMYDIHYQRWLKWFDPKQIFVVNGDKLITNPVPILQKIETYLNISHYFKDSMFIMNDKKGFFCWKKNAKQKNPRCFGSHRGQEHPTLSDSTLYKLKSFLKPHTRRFCHMANVNFNWCSL